MVFFGKLPNPGRLEEIKKEAQAVLSPDVFDGARFEFNKGLNQKFALVHSITMSSAVPGAYEFGANFVDEQLMMVSRVNMQGNLTGRVNWQPTESWLARMQAQVGPEAQGNNTFKADLDYKGGSFSIGGYCIGGGMWGGSYLQSLTKGLSIGCEGFYHNRNQKVRGGALASRYVWGDKEENVATAKVGTFGNGAVELSYHRKVRSHRHATHAHAPATQPLPPSAPISAPIDLRPTRLRSALLTRPSRDRRR